MWMMGKKTSKKKWDGGDGIGSLGCAWRQKWMENEWQNVLERAWTESRRSRWKMSQKFKMKLELMAYQQKKINKKNKQNWRSDSQAITDKDVAIGDDSIS